MALNALGSIVGGVLKSVTGGDKAEGKKAAASGDGAASSPLTNLVNNKVAEQAKLAKEVANLISN